MLDISFWQNLPEPKIVFLNGIYLPDFSTPGNYQVEAKDLIFNQRGFWNIWWVFTNNSEEYRVNIEINSKLNLQTHFLNTAKLVNLYLAYQIGSQGELNNFQTNQDSTALVLNHKFDLALDGHLTNYFCYNAPLKENTLINLAQKSQCKIWGASWIKEKIILKQNWKIIHQADQTKSQVYVKNVLETDAQGEFDCLVEILPLLREIKTEVVNHNLLLSKKARMLTKPQLIIKTQEVAATHGASTGNLSPDALFYLQSRGIPLITANHLLTQAFLQEIYEQFPRYS